jgi:hypothetical protein
MLSALVCAVSLQAGAGGVETIARDAMSHVEAPGEAVARTPADWAALWRRHAGDAPAPPVDFAKRTVVAVFLGTRSTAGYVVEITGTRQQGGTLIVAWREGRPDPGQITAQIITSPAHIVSLPKFAGEIRFEKIGQEKGRF